MKFLNLQDTLSIEEKEDYNYVCIEVDRLFIKKSLPTLSEEVNNILQSKTEGKDDLHIEIKISKLGQKYWYSIFLSYCILIANFFGTDEDKFEEKHIGTTDNIYSSSDAPAILINSKFLNKKSKINNLQITMSRKDKTLFSLVR